MIRPSLPSVHTSIVAAALVLGGCARCPYDQRCNGNVLEVCSLGVDQMVGSPSYSASTCADPNPVCQATSDRGAACVMPQAPKCDSNFVPQCATGELAVHCEGGYQVATNCTVDDNACVATEGRARCARTPITSCSAKTHRNSCEDATHLLYCREELVARQDCSNEPTKVCTPNVPRDAYEQSAFCQAEKAR